MERLTSKNSWGFVSKHLDKEYGYSYIWKRLNAIENILGDNYNLEDIATQSKYNSMKNNYIEAITNYQELLYDLCFDDNGSQIFTIDQVKNYMKTLKGETNVE